MTEAPGGQPVQAVGEVDAVGGRGDDQVGPQDEEDRAEHGAAEGQVQPRDVADQGDLGGRRGEAVRVREVQGQDGEDDADGALQDQLGLGVQAKAALLVKS